MHAKFIPRLLENHEKKHDVNACTELKNLASEDENFCQE